MLDVAAVLGTYNRCQHLQYCIESIRRSMWLFDYVIVVVDGGSTDGSSEWLQMQTDVVLIQQKLPLTGAVRAFNLGYGRGLDLGAKYILHVNDDVELMGGANIRDSIAELEHQKVGALAFRFNAPWHGGQWNVNYFHGYPYLNYGLFKRSPVMHAARAQGDPEGRKLWNPLYRTYGADVETCCWLHKLGYGVGVDPGISRVCDLAVQDQLREGNGGGMDVTVIDRDRIFMGSRWPSADALDPNKPTCGPKRIDK